MKDLSMTQQPLLSVSDLRLEIDNRENPYSIVDRVSFDVASGERVAIVGESGSGKSLLGMALLGLSRPPITQTAGTIRHEGMDLAAMSDRQRQALRGGRAAMIFQDPMNALNPVMTIGVQIEECLEVHQPQLKRRQRRAKARQLLELVRVPAAEKRVHSYPHELSGGLRQRVLIAMALANDPRLIVADEPTTALDVTVQAQIMATLRNTRAADTAIILITHDMGLVAENADRVIVFYAGKIVEDGPVLDVLTEPQHPYTRALLASQPEEAPAGTLQTIAGEPPDFRRLPPGCAFHPRCESRMPACSRVTPRHVFIKPGHRAACLLHDRNSEAAA
jgi:oligopeptide/dipeptide ABC transporter ATP-binding protein